MAEAGRSSGAPALVEVVVRDWVRLGGIEFGGLVEVVGEWSLGDLYSFRADRPTLAQQPRVPHYVEGQLGEADTTSGMGMHAPR